MKRDIIRTCRFAPYLKGKGPTFILRVWDCHRLHGNGPQYQLGYELRIKEPGARRSVVMFVAENYGCSPCHAIDSDASIAGLMSFLTLRPGDTDSEYFEGYTPGQLAFASQHGESLGLCAMERFGEV